MRAFSSCTLSMYRLLTFIPALTPARAVFCAISDELARQVSKAVHSKTLFSLLLVFIFQCPFGFTYGITKGNFEPIPASLETIANRLNRLQTIQSQIENIAQL